MDWDFKMAQANIQELRTLIHKLEESSSISKTVPDSILDENGAFYESDLPQVVQDIIKWLCENVITSSGSVNSTLINKLKTTYDITIGRGEYDSFGWLSGYLLTSKGRVYFG